MTETLFQLQDLSYRDFQRKLIPGIDPDAIIGVRTPELRRLAKGVDASFRAQLPHRYFEENQIHAFSLESIADFEEAVREVDAFLPYVDNWATCDQLRPKAFGKNREKLLPFVRKWLGSGHTYSVRFGMEMLMCHYLDDLFHLEYPEMVAAASHEDYYVRMMQAWYFATALAKQYEQVCPYITHYRLDKWVHNKTIQKALESYRISPAKKEMLKQYRIK